MDMILLLVRYSWGKFLPETQSWYSLFYLYTMEQEAWGTWVSCSYASAYRICQRFDELLISVRFIIIKLLPPICSCLAWNTKMDVMQYSTWLELINSLSSYKCNHLLLKSLGLIILSGNKPTHITTTCEVMTNVTWTNYYLIEQQQHIFSGFCSWEVEPKTHITANMTYDTFRTKTHLLIKILSNGHQISCHL